MFSELGHYNLNALSASELIRKLSLFNNTGTCRTAKMCFHRWAVLAGVLWSKTWSCVVRLVLVEFPSGSLRARSLRESPFGHILLCARVCWGFRDVAAWANGSGSRNIVFKSSSTALVTKGIQWVLSCFRLLIHVILGTRVGILVNTSLHARLSSNFRGADTFTTSIIGVSGLIEEKHVVVVVVFGLNRRHFLFITKRKFGCLKKGVTVK